MAGFAAPHGLDRDANAATAVSSLRGIDAWKQKARDVSGVPLNTSRLKKFRAAKSAILPRAPRARVAPRSVGRAGPVS
jgi:hypothetical protein